MLQPERHPHFIVAPPHVRRAQSKKNARLNTLDDVIAFAHAYSQEIRNDAKARRIYRTFAALTNNQFEALLAFSLWKVRGTFTLS